MTSVFHRTDASASVVRKSAENVQLIRLFASNPETQAMRTNALG